jgi:hypothetical protein
VPPWTAGGPSVFGPAGSYETPPRS